MLASTQISGQHLSGVEVKDIAESLKANSIRMLSLRDCKAHDEDFVMLMKAVGRCKSLFQLNLNLGIVKDSQRAQNIANALTKNRSLTTLFLHGSPIGDAGVVALCKGLALHPNIVSLDIGDCLMTDASLPYVSDLLPPNGAKRGLHHLTLSANPAVSISGWAKFFTAVGASHMLRTLHLDYNRIGDYGIGCLSVILATSRSLEVLDLEGNGISEFGGQILLHLVKNFPVSTRQLILSENKIKDATCQAIQSCLDIAMQSTVATSSRNDDKTVTTEVTETVSDSVTDGDGTLDSDTESSGTEQLMQRRSGSTRAPSHHVPATPPPRITPEMVAMATQKAQRLEAARANLRVEVYSDETMSDLQGFDDDTTNHNTAGMLSPNRAYLSTSSQNHQYPHSSSRTTYDSTSTREAMHQAYREALEANVLSS